MQNDNWGVRARIGLFIVGNEAVPEAEWWAMVPRGVSVHAARVTAGSPWTPWRADRSGVELPEDVVRGCRQFGAMRLNAVVLAHTTSSVVGGAGWHEATVSAIGAALGNGAFVTTNGHDTIEALRASGIARPFVVVPPWFSEATAQTAVGYYREHGFAPSGHMRMDPGPTWREVPQGELYPRGFGFEQDVESLYEQIRAACPANADGVLIGGTGFRCVGIIEALEEELGRPVVTANQASLWRCLKHAGIADEIHGYGRLLRSSR
jgi:maleate isomerase